MQMNASKLSSFLTKVYVIIDYHILLLLEKRCQLQITLPYPEKAESKTPEKIPAELLSNKF